MLTLIFLVVLCHCCDLDLIIVVSQNSEDNVQETMLGMSFLTVLLNQICFLGASSILPFSEEITSLVMVMLVWLVFDFGVGVYTHLAQLYNCVALCVLL